jgi:hypothetical protein
LERYMADDFVEHGVSDRISLPGLGGRVRTYAVELTPTSAGFALKAPCAQSQKHASAKSSCGSAV